MTATITSYKMTYPVWDFVSSEVWNIKKASQTFKTEEEAEKAMVKIAKADKELVKKADPMIWQVKKVVKTIEVDN